MKVYIFNQGGEVVSIENPTSMLIEVDSEGETHLGTFTIQQAGGTLNLKGDPSVILQTSPTAEPGINLHGGFWAGNPASIAEFRAGPKAIPEPASDTPSNVIPGNFGNFVSQDEPLALAGEQAFEPIEATVDRLTAMLAGWRPLDVPLRIDGVVRKVTILARAAAGPIGVVPPEAA